MTAIDPDYDDDMTPEEIAEYEAEFVFDLTFRLNRDTGEAAPATQSQELLYEMACDYGWLWTKDVLGDVVASCESTLEDAEAVNLGWYTKFPQGGDPILDPVELAVHLFTGGVRPDEDQAMNYYIGADFDFYGLDWLSEVGPSPCTLRDPRVLQLVSERLEKDAEAVIELVLNDGTSDPMEETSYAKMLEFAVVRKLTDRIRGYEIRPETGAEEQLAATG